MVCPSCGYALTGLPKGQSCPECGEAISKDRVVLWGEGHADSRGRSLRLGVLLILIVAFLLLSLIDLRVGVVVLVFGVSTLAIWALIANRRSLKIAGGQPMQLRIGPEGFGLRRGFGHVYMIPWRRTWELRVAPTTLGKYNLVVYRSFAGAILLSEPLNFTASIQADEAEVLTRRVKEWIERAK